MREKLEALRLVEVKDGQKHQSVYELLQCSVLKLPLFDSVRTRRVHVTRFFGRDASIRLPVAVWCPHRVSLVHRASSSLEFEKEFVRLIME